VPERIDTAVKLVKPPIGQAAIHGRRADPHSGQLPSSDDTVLALPQTSDVRVGNRHQIAGGCL